MRTKFLLSMLLISASLTWTSLLVVRRSIQTQVKKEIFADLENSVSTFQNFQRERELSLIRSAELLADLPDLRALMTTQHEATIQDGSSALSRLAGGDLFALADRRGRIVALHTASPDFTAEMAQRELSASLNNPGPSHWWFGNHRLYQTVLKPIYFGPESDNHLLGLAILGYEINDTVASQVSRIAASRVAFYYGDTIVCSTLPPAQEAELANSGFARPKPGKTQPEQIQLNDEHFLGTSLELAADRDPSVRLIVLKSYDQATAFLDGLNRLLLALGLAAVAAGSLLVFLISHTFTRPLGSLVSGVRALGRGDFSYPLDARGGDEVAEVTQAFDRMRKSLLKTHQELIDAEKLATIGRMASSISHDLRHSLAAVVANAEFLCESELSADQREELYQEVRMAVNQMTDLIDSLLEFSRTRESLRPSYGNLRTSVDRTVQAIRLRPEFHKVRIDVQEDIPSLGWYDPKKLERALYNLVVNACESLGSNDGCVLIDIHGVANGVEIRVIDNGRGIPESIRTQLFDPFISCGKENGTGLGLTVVQKIVQDHGGDVILERTSTSGSVFKLALPLLSPTSSDEGGTSLPPLVRIQQKNAE
ncbi:MAG TPA: HAMP domain-containing sensor histidine kinase [Terriglobales bacterium]|nr:HAMP domain-containing sensor histidine kinase [Terriglobales bacterium]